MLVVKELTKRLAMASVALLILFLGGVSYVFGSVYRSGYRVHNIEVLFVDRDQGAIGQAVTAAYQELQGPTFFTFVPKNASRYQSDDALVKAVTDGHYWAALAVNEGSTERYFDAISENSSITYDSSQVLTYVWNGVRYPAYSDSLFPVNFQVLAQVSSAAFEKMYGEKSFGILKNQSQPSPESLSAFFNPIGVTQINVQAMDQGSRVFYSTLVMAMVILQQFFFALAIHFIFDSVKAHESLSLVWYVTVRVVGSLLFCLGASFCMAGNLWAFREDWSVNGNQYVLTAMTFWLLMNIHSLIFQSAILLLPLFALPFIIISWVLINVTSTATPFVLNPGFYRWAYAVPSYEAYQVMTDIWSRGSVPALFRALPILFSWWVTVLTIMSTACYLLYKKSKQTARVNTEEKSGPSLLQ
ncbi:hypothetical protein TRVA0_035S00188 [Trichomonascus vanleenenianus]|uniref:SNG1 family protein n=1 Tax=Trichomonascus vanleenenianus TaxID=2268995 RepID=UPI003EC9D3ED